VRVLPAPVVAAVLRECFRYSPEALKVHLLLKVAVPAPVAQLLLVIPALYQDEIFLESFGEDKT